MKFEINTDKIIDNVVSEALERRIDGKTIKQWMTEIAKHQWISVKDRLPEEDKTVLVVRKYVKPGHREIRYVETATRIGDDWVSNEDEYKINRNFHTQPYAWMPLPEPPKDVK